MDLASKNDTDLTGVELIDPQLSLNLENIVMSYSKLESIKD